MLDRIGFRMWWTMKLTWIKILAYFINSHICVFLFVFFLYAQCHLKSVQWMTMNYYNKCLCFFFNGYLHMIPSLINRKCFFVSHLFAFELLNFYQLNRLDAPWTSSKVCKFLFLLNGFFLSISSRWIVSFNFIYHVFNLFLSQENSMFKLYAQSGRLSILFPREFSL